MHLIRENKLIRPTLGRMVVEAPYVSRYRKAGQFIILRINESGERIPLTISDSDSTEGTITLYYQVVGTSTRKMALIKPGEYITDIVGPLGHPTEIDKYGTVICVGGGIGIAPLFPISSALKESGNRVINILGARSADHLILEDEMSEIADECIVCTDDGTRGEKAIVTDILVKVLSMEKINFIVAVGPVPMMKAVCDLTRLYGITTIVSLNSIMIDGTGMCGGCRVTVGSETKFTCVDGPEFNGHLVDFDNLKLRLKTYHAEEAVSYEAYKHECRLDGVTTHE